MDLSSLQSCLEDVHNGLHLFFENQYAKERVHLNKYKDQSLVHAMELAYASCCFSTLSMEKPEIEQNIEDCNFAMKLCEKQRKVNSIGESLSGWFKKPDYNKYTDGNFLA